RRDRVERDLDGFHPGLYRAAFNREAVRIWRIREEDIRDRPGRYDAGTRLDSLEKLLVEARDLGSFAILRSGQLNAHRDEVAWIEAQLKLLKPYETSNQQTRSHQQHK